MVGKITMEVVRQFGAVNIAGELLKIAHVNDSNGKPRLKFLRLPVALDLKNRHE